MRVIGKYINRDTGQRPARVEDAFQRALALNSRLSVAHKFYAQLEADTGRAEQAVVRLLTEATGVATIPSSLPESPTPAAIAAL